MRFWDRSDAGSHLVKRLRLLKLENPLVLALTRGGVITAFEVARGIEAELQFIGQQKPLHPQGRSVVIVDDGSALKKEVQSLLGILRKKNAERVILALPAAPLAAIEVWKKEFDQVAYVEAVKEWGKISDHYEELSEVSDAQVNATLEKAKLLQKSRQPLEIEIPLKGGSSAFGLLDFPKNPQGLVILSHGSSSSRHGSRNTVLTQSLHQDNLATLLVDLLMPEEAEQASLNEVEMLAERLKQVTSWTRENHVGHQMPLGYFGAGVGAAGVLRTAADMGPDVRAVVCRAARLDLVGKYLHGVLSPTLFIVGGDDLEVLRMHETALASIEAEHRLEIIPGATRHFEEPGTLEAVSYLASDWLASHFQRPPGIRGEVTSQLTS